MKAKWATPGDHLGLCETYLDPELDCTDMVNGLVHLLFEGSDNLTHCLKTNINRRITFGSMYVYGCAVSGGRAEAYRIAGHGCEVHGLIVLTIARI
jgi:hypothetical protein